MGPWRPPMAPLHPHTGRGGAVLVQTSSGNPALTLPLPVCWGLDKDPSHLPILICPGGSSPLGSHLRH